MKVNRNSSIGIIIIIAVAVIGTYLYINSNSSLSVLGVTYCYSDGKLPTCEEFKTTTTSGMKVVVDSRELDYILVSLYVQPRYEGVASRWKIDGTINARTDYVATPKQSWVVTEGTTKPSGNDGLVLVQQEKVVPSTIEGWVGNGQHRVSFCATVKVTLYNDLTGESTTPIEGSGGCSDITFEVSNVAGTLKLISVYLEVNSAAYAKVTCPPLFPYC